MKILILVAVLLAVCGQSAVNVQADVIECDINDDLFGYTCHITSIKRDENQNVITGSHKTGRSDSDVKVVYYHSERNSIKLTNFDSIFCQKFPNLERIDFYNLKPANLAENALLGCQHLNFFQLFQADIKQIPDNFFSNNLKLIEISLYQSQLETLPENIFSGLKELDRLYFNKNQLNYLPENIFESQTNLTNLWLDSNKLSTLNPAWFNNLRNLEVLCLDTNKIEELPKGIFVGLEKLKTLYLGNNNLVTIHADSFGKKPQLSTVGLSNNKITSIDEKFFDNTAVAWLNMEGNNCSQEYITSRDKTKENSQQCFDNYQRQFPSTSSAAPKHKIKWNLWLSLSLLTFSFSFWKF